jgi:hypothetical protein
VGNVKVHETELEGFADVLGDDPILLALFIDTLRRSPVGNPSIIALDVLSAWSNTVIVDLSLKTTEPTTEYGFAIESLAAEIVVRKTLYPAVHDLRSWFPAAGNTAHLLLQLAEAGHLCHISNPYGIPTFEFRHDRILEFFVARTLSIMLDNQPSVPSAVWDPFFTPFLGQAIGHRIRSDAVLDEILVHNPTALIAALPHLSDATPKYSASIKERVRAWLAKDPSVSSPMWRYGASLLHEMTGTAVLEVTDGLSNDRILLEARLRNGDVKAGARVLASRFWPSISAPWIEAIIAQSRIRHESAMVSELGPLLRSPNISDEIRTGVLVLAGYIGNSQLIGDVRKCWQLSKDKKEMVLPALWAALRCTDARPEESIGAIMPVLLDLENDPTGQSYSRRQSVLQEIGWSARHGFTQSALAYLLALGEVEDYRGIVIAILSEVPEATTAPFVVRQMAERDNRARQAGLVSPFPFFWVDRWRRWRTEGRIPESCIDELRKMWKSGTDAEWVRRYALTTWDAAAGDLEGLRSIPPADPLHQSAVWFRMLLGDCAVTPDVLALVPTKPWWLEHISKIWSDELEIFFEARLERHAAAPPENVLSDEDFHLAHVLRDIPPERGERLLTRYWDGLKTRPLFIQLALYLSTVRSRSLAASALQQGGKDVLKHVDYFFGLTTLGLVDKLSLKHLESLRPHLALLSDMAVSHIIEFCGKYGHLRWAETHLLPEYERRRREQTEVNNGQNAGIIKRSVLQWMPSTRDIFAQLLRIA